MGISIAVHHLCDSILFVNRKFMIHVMNKSQQIFMKTIDYLKSCYYGGDKYNCTLCKNCSNRLINKNVQHNKINCCPFCGSLQQEILIKFIIDYLLDRNCSINILYIRSFYTYDQLVKEFDRNIRIKYKIFDLESLNSFGKQNVFNLPFNDGEFDLIIADYVLERVLNEKFYAKELSRLMNETGFTTLNANINVNAHSTNELKHFSLSDNEDYYGIKGNYRRYGNDYVKRLSNMSLSVAEIYYENNYYYIAAKHSSNEINSKILRQYIIKTDIQPILSFNPFKIIGKTVYFNYIVINKTYQRFQNYYKKENSFLKWLVINLAVFFILFTFGWLVLCFIPLIGIVGVPIMALAILNMSNTITNSDKKKFNRLALLSLTIFIIILLSDFYFYIFNTTLGALISGWVYNLNGLAPKIN